MAFERGFVINRTVTVMVSVRFCL